MSLNDGMLGLNYSPTPSGNVHYSFNNNANFPGLMQLHVETDASHAPNGYPLDTNINISMPAQNVILSSGSVIDVHEGAQYWSKDTKQAYPLPNVQLLTTVQNGVPASGLNEPAWPYQYQENQNKTN
jgi:hypothetical protein